MRNIIRRLIVCSGLRKRVLQTIIIVIVQIKKKSERHFIVLDYSYRDCIYVCRDTHTLMILFLRYLIENYQWRLLLTK